MPRKPRRDSKLKTLSQEVRDELFHIMEELGWEAVLVHLAEVEGISSSRSAVYSWFSWEDLKRRADVADKVTAQLMEMVEERGDLDTSQLDDVSHWLFTTLAVEQGDVGDFVKLMTLKQQRDKLQLDEAKFSELQRKARAADRASAVLKDKKLTPEEKNAEIDRLLGITS